MTHNWKIMLAGIPAVIVLLANSTAAVAAAPGAGYDVSYVQCGAPLPIDPAFGIVGVNAGTPYSENPCLSDEYQWASAAPAPPSFYMNLANPGLAGDYWDQGGPQPCSGDADDAGCAYNYGWQAAAYAVDLAQARTGTSQGAWWVDVETANSWSTNAATNLAAITGGLDYLAGSGASSAGIYSTARDWRTIAGGASGFESVPNWVAGAGDSSGAASRCADSFTGGPVALSQYPDPPFSADLDCASG